MSLTFEKPVVTVTLNPAIDRIIDSCDLKMGGVNVIKSFNDIPGGKGINVSKVLKDLGVSSICTGLLGEYNGAVFKKFFQENMLNNNFITYKGLNRVNLKIIDGSKKVTEINFPNLENHEGNYKKLKNYLLDLDSEIFVLAGSLPNSLPLETYKDMVCDLKKQNKIVALDTSGLPLSMALEVSPNIIKPNIFELEEIAAARFLKHQDILDMASIYVKKGIEVVMVSMGSDGAIFVNKNKAYHIKAKRVSIKNTVGAGDSMVAGFVAGYYKGASFLNCAKLATVASIATIGIDGVGFINSSPEDFYGNLVIKQL